MLRKVPLLAMVTASVLLTSLRAEVKDLSPEELGKTATHVITGKVTDVYNRSDEKATTEDWVYIRHVAEVVVEDCEKGDGVKKGDLVYVRYWERWWVGKGEAPSHKGHRGMPRIGESHRIYLSRNANDGFGENKDGGFNVIGPNGFEKLKPVPKK